MGFVVKRKVFKLVFEEPELEGLEVKCKSIDVDKLLNILDLLKVIDSDDLDHDSAVKVFTFLADLVESWNVETEDHTPIQPDFEGVKSLEFSFAVNLLKDCVEAISGVGDPLEKPSPTGSQAPPTLPVELKPQT